MSANNVERKIEQLLRQHNFRLVRQTKHLVYQEPGGRVFVCAATPSDWRAAERSLSILKRVIDNPPKPMVLAIEEYEREAAAQVIAGREKAKVVAAGMGSGKQRPSRGTGYSYVGENLCEHGNPKRYPCALCIASKACNLPEDEIVSEPAESRESRQERRNKERRAAKLAKRAAKLQAQQAEEAEFQKKFGPFLNVIERLVQENERLSSLEFKSLIEHPTWQKDLTFCELPPESPVDWSERFFGGWRALYSMATALRRNDNLDDKDSSIEWIVECCQKFVSRSDARIHRVMKFVNDCLREREYVGYLTKRLERESDEHYKKDETMDFRMTFSFLEVRIREFVAELFPLDLIPEDDWCNGFTRIDGNQLTFEYGDFDEEQPREPITVDFTEEKVEAVAA